MQFDLLEFEFRRELERKAFHANVGKSWHRHWLSCDLDFDRFFSPGEEGRGGNNKALYLIPTESNHAR